MPSVPLFNHEASFSSLILSVSLLRRCRRRRRRQLHLSSSVSPQSIHHGCHFSRLLGQDLSSLQICFIQLAVGILDTMMAGARWKGKSSELKALSQPMSRTVSDLQSTFSASSSTTALLSGSSVLLHADPTQTDLLNRTCFGRPIITAQNNDEKQWFQLCLEEAFYLSHALNCLDIVTKSGKDKDDSCGKKSSLELWCYMCSKMENFPYLYAAYSHLRKKNWVVRSGSQYGVDYVAYRHHPALVHSEYAVLVLSDTKHGQGGGDGRLRVWSDVHCSVRLCGSVAKTLLAVRVLTNDASLDSPHCLEKFSVEERTVTRWSPQQTREEQTDRNLAKS